MKKKKNAPYTKIMNNRFYSNISYDVIRKGIKNEKVMLEIHKVLINNEPKFVLKSIIIECFNNKKLVEKCIRYILNELKITHALGLIAPISSKMLDIEKVEYKLNNKKKEIIIEILLNYDGENLHNLSVVNEEVVYEIIYQLINILCLIEQIGIAHIDIKPGNILWNSTSLKLIDFETGLNYYQTPEQIMKPINKNILGYTECSAPPAFIPYDLLPQQFFAYSFCMTFYLLLLISTHQFDLKFSFK